MDVTAQIEWNKHTLNGLREIPDTILYKVAKETLDLSYPIIPKDTHTMARSSMSGGVRGGNGDFYIGSYTDYAKYPWVMEGVNWTTPGTNNKWFARALKEHGTTIINSAIDKSWKEVM